MSQSWVGLWVGKGSPASVMYPLGGYMYAGLTLIFMLDTMCWLNLASLTCIIIIKVSGSPLTKNFLLISATCILAYFHMRIKSHTYMQLCTIATELMYTLLCLTYVLHTLLLYS